MTNEVEPVVWLDGQCGMKPTNAVMLWLGNSTGLVD